METKTSSFLFAQGGPLLRWRTALDLLPDDPSIDRKILLSDLLACAGVHRWLDLLGRFCPTNSQKAFCKLPNGWRR